MLIAWTFVRLTQRFNHAGSVYGFVGATLGARAGVISGWALMGTYTFYGVVTSTGAGIFGADFLNALGIWTNQPGWAPYLVGAIALAGVWALAAANIREGTKVLLVIEGTTVALILIVSVVILIKLATGTAPNGNTLDFSVFSVPAGTGTSAVFLGVVFGFLSSRASRRPRRWARRRRSLAATYRARSSASRSSAACTSSSSPP